ncbi:Rieske 2Fe-2S domain-containing protein [Microbacterium testaceum]|uniref:Rieske 2Fe-2S domain-containing protein n=1 Tax=Microbacterium testaceum TaxID=2033 RepID=UPI001D17B445|nr:Rieske 2Fe-2S domain-containing protein [Microbacterium testaceum]MCC4250767.1 Rieske 2Fe-2S domain-containing protein [Microbacterium testaceum]
MGHESEIPQPGDYVVRRVLDDSFIVVRDESGSVKAMFNMCLHRGMQVCRAEMGNASHFRCPYHGWSYRNDGRIVGLPFHEEAYGGEAGFNRKGARLLPAPSLDSYNGLIFISMDPDAPPLIDYLGDFAFYLDYYTKQSSSGIELRGPQRWRVKANWKIGAENFAGDMYHTPQTHTSVVEIGLFREPKAEKRKDGNTYWAGNGGGTTYKLPEGTLEERLRYVGYPDEMIDRMKEVWSQDQLNVIGENGFMISAASIFPNMSFVHNWPKVEDGDDVLPFISIRTWQPISENETEVLSWFAVDAAAPEEFKALSYKAYLMCFGSTLCVRMG